MPCGVIAVETRTVEYLVPADPADVETEAKVRERREKRIERERERERGRRERYRESTIPHYVVHCRQYLKQVRCGFLTPPSRRPKPSTT